MHKTKKYFQQTTAKLLLLALLLQSCDQNKLSTNSPTSKEAIALSHSKEFDLASSSNKQQFLTINTIYPPTEVGASHPSIQAFNSESYIWQHKPMAMPPKPSSDILQDSTQPITKPNHAAIKYLLHTSLDWKTKEGYLLHKLTVNHGNLYATIHHQVNPGAKQKLPVVIVPETQLAHLNLYSSVQRAHYLHIILNNKDNLRYLFIGQPGGFGGGKNKKKKKIRAKGERREKEVARQEEKGKEKCVDTQQEGQEIETEADTSTSESLILPDPQVFYKGTIEAIPALTEQIEKNMQKASSIISQHPEQEYFQEVLKLYHHAAKFGNTDAMYQIGLICEQQQNMELAKRWFMLAFQNSWFKNPVAAFNSTVYNKIDQSEDTFKRLLWIYTPDMDTPGKKWGRYNTIIEFYKKVQQNLT